MATAGDLIKRSFKLIGVLADGETPTASMQSDALDTLNDLIASWSNNGYLIYEESRETFDLSAGKHTYSIGPSGDFDTVRPHLIKKAFIDDGSMEIVLDVYNQDQWAAIGVKRLSSTIPQAIYYNPSYPLGELKLWPVPSVAYDIVLYTLKPITEFQDANTQISLPPGYARALRFNLAIELAPEYGVSASPEVIAAADDAKTWIQRANTRPVYMRNEVAGVVDRKPFNWLTGE